MAAAVGIDPIHMGIIFIVNLEIGYLTPPVGLNLFVSSTLFKRSLGFVIRAVLPTLAIMMLSLVAITWVPAFSLGLVQALDDQPPAATTTPVTPSPDAAAPDAATPGRVKSLQELMQEAQGGSGAAGGADAGAGAAPRVKSLQELMEEAKAKAGDAAGADAGVEGAAAPAPAAPPRVKSLQELMQEAKAKEAADAAPATP